MAGILAIRVTPARTNGAMGADIAGPGMPGLRLGKAGAAVIPTCLPSHGQAAAMQHGNVCIATRRRTDHCSSMIEPPR